MRSKILQQILDETPKEVEIFVKLYGDIVVRVHQIIKEKGISQKDLAERLGKTPSEISKWLSGDHNFTLRSLAKLQAELDEIILYVARKDSFHVQRGGQLSASTQKAEPISGKVEFKGTIKNRPVEVTKPPMAA
jgi:transcriptional regulator with XRE-family HTH domain